MTKTKQTTLTTTFFELVLAVTRWAEEELDLHLSNFRPGAIEVTLQDQFHRQLTLSVDAKGAPVVTGPLAELINVPAAIDAHRKREADAAADLKRANIADRETLEAAAKAEQNTTGDA
jgi:hypothetical protein